MRSWVERLRTWIGGRYWGRVAHSGGIPTWMGERVVRERINRRISGDPGTWPTDWLASRVEHPISSAVSLGCGEGALERDLVEKGICSSIVGIDASTGSIELARERAAALGLDTITYRIGDMNHPGLEKSRYRAAFFHQALHHVSNLDVCLRDVRNALEESGWLYLDEYVGPSRTEWSRERIADAQAVYETLPDELKLRRRVGYPIDRRDPTEAIRSGEILGILGEHFEVIERRDYGGNLLSLIHPNLNLVSLAEDERDMILEAMLDIEDELLDRGAPSYYTILLARPR